MLTLLEFSINTEKYGVIKADRNEANRYINQVTHLLRKRGVLKSLAPQGSGYKYRLIGDSEILVSISNLRNATYQIDIFNDDSFIKSYRTNSYQSAATVIFDNSQFNTYLYVTPAKGGTPLACIDIIRVIEDGTIAQISNTEPSKPDWLSENPDIEPLAIAFTIFVVITYLTMTVSQSAVSPWWVIIALLLLAILLKYTVWHRWSTNKLYKTALLAPVILSAIGTGIADIFIASQTSVSTFAAIISTTIDVTIIILLYIIASTDFKSLKK